MAYTVPNAFSNGTVIDSEDVQENNQALLEYVNEGIATSDISTASTWVEAKHIMKGYYNPIQNRYEMQTGVYGGHPTFPFFHPGYFGEQFFQKGGSGRGVVPNCSVDFYLEREATVFFYFTLSPRALAPLDTSTPTFTLMNLRLDGTAYNASQNTFTEQIEVNNTANPDEPIPSRYRRRTWSHQIVFRELSAGEHFIEIVGQSGPTSVPLKFYNYSLQAFY